MFFSSLMLIALVIGLITISILWGKLKKARARSAEAELYTKQSEAQRRQLIQHMGHEIRNPLNAILGMCDLVMQDVGVPVERRQNILVMRCAAQQLLMVSTNLFSYHAGDDQPLTQRAEIVSVPNLVEDARESVGSLLAQKRLRLDVLSETGCPFQIEADTQILRQIVVNVLWHSVGLTTHGHVTVTVHETSNEDQLHLSVTDTGPTLDAQDSGRLFEPYGLDTQLRSAMEPGTGLNLFVARKLARQLGGEVTHRTHPNAGSIYDVVVPARVLSSQTPETGSSASVVVAFNDTYIRHREHVRPQRILVTEDQRSNQQLLVSILTKAGHITTVAGTGSESIALLQSESYDLGIMDLRLPGVSGLEVMKLSRLNSNGNANIPFIVLTGETGENIRLACTAAGAAAFLAKPISAQRLLDTVSAVTDRVLLLADRDVSLAPDARAITGVNDPILSTLTPRVVTESMRDALRYTQDAVQACRDGNVDLARQRIRAIRGTAHAVGASHLIDTCRGILGWNDETLRSSAEMVATELDAALNEAQAILANLVSQDCIDQA